MRADSGFYTHAIVAVCRKMDVRYSITVRQHARLRNIIEATPETDWTPIPYWMDGAADVAETSYVPFQDEPDAAPVRLIVRRVKATPGYGLTETIKLPRPLIRGAGPKLEHRGEAPADSPVAPPGAWPRAAPGPDTASRSTPRRHPRTPGRRAAWCR